MKRLFSPSICLFLSLASSTTACSSAQNSAPPDAAHYASTMAGAFCSGLRGCCEQKGFAYDDSSCTAQMTAYFQSDSRVGVDAVKRGNVIYDAAAAARCAQAYKEREGRCSVSDSGIAIGDAGIVDAVTRACADVLRGTLRPGELCTADAECAAPDDQTVSRCDVDNFAAPLSAPGRVCYQTKSHVPPGGKCDADGHTPSTCEPSLGFCTDELGRLATRGTCKAFARIGDGCTYEVSGAVVLCDPGSAACDVPTQRCVEAPKAGQRCGVSSAPGGGCAAGAYCENSTCTAEKEDGKPCKQPGECVSGICTRDVIDSVDGRCSAGAMNDVSPRSCGFGPNGSGPEQAGIKPPAKAP
jgi:hypothetical protein